MPQKSKRDETPPTQAVSYFDDNYIVELAKDSKGLHFWELNGGPPQRLKGSRPKEDLHLIPIKDPHNSIETMVSLAEKPVDYKSQPKLIEDITEFIHRYLDCAPEWELLIAHYCLLTWVYDQFSAIPYLRFLGDIGTGKTRKLEICHSICYRSIMLGVATSPASIYRLMEKYKGTLILDEADWASSNMQMDIVKILNAAYKWNGTVVRNIMEGGDYDPRPFRVFGPKVIANRANFEDDAIESRCLTIKEFDKELREDIPRLLPKEFFIEALELRNKLLKWRFDTVRNIRINEQPLKFLAPRACETGTSIYSISLDEKFRAWLLDFLSSKGDQEKEESPKTLIAQIILSRYKEGRRIFFNEIIEDYDSQQDIGVLPLSGAKLKTYIDALKISRGNRVGRGNNILPTNEEIARLRLKYTEWER